MSEAKEAESIEIDVSPFSDLVGEEITEFIFDNAPRKVVSRVAKALDHYSRSEKLVGHDEEMGAIRLIAAEEELVVANFEFLKLYPERFPEHADFVRKFKNHQVKLAFYPVLQQFRFVLADMLKEGFTLDGLEGVLNWTAKPVVDGKQIKLALLKESGEEIIKADPFAVDISRGDLGGQATVPFLLEDLKKTILDQTGKSLRQFILARSEYRNQLLYSSDGGSIVMGESLSDLRQIVGQTLHDLLWVLALLVGGNPPSKKWGIASQFIATYRLALIEAKLLKIDNTLEESDAAS